MNYDSLEKDLNTNLRSIYLLYGEEQYLIETALKKIKKKFGELLLGINYIIIDESNLDNLISNIEMPAFGYEKKLIVVKNSGLFKKEGRKKEPTIFQDKIGNYIQDNLSLIEEGVILIFVEKEIDKNFVYNIIEKLGIVCEAQLLRVDQLVSKLMKICLLYKVNVSEKTLKYLIETSGVRLQELINEIRKLIEYVGENGTITEKEVDLLAIKQVESVIFDLTDNLGTKNTEKALEVLNNLLYQKEPLQKIVVILYYHFKKLYLCKLALHSNKNMITVLNLKPNQTFLVEKYKKQARYFTENELKIIMQELVKLDYNSKIGNIDVYVGLISVLCRYC